MTYQEELEAQKAAYTRFVGKLVNFWHMNDHVDDGWSIYYPQKNGQWARCYVERYDGTYYMGFSGGWQVTLKPGKEFKLDHSHVYFGWKNMLCAADDLCAWLDEVAKDWAKAARRVAEEFPKDERKGVIPRPVVERYVHGMSIGKALGRKDGLAFADIFASGYFKREENAYVTDMTANKFFEYCRIAYIAGQEKEDRLDEKMTGRDMYERYSDGRYGALLDIDPDSHEQFMAWLDGKVPCDRHGGDHPWEIKRGGNTTHIDLYVYRPHDSWRYRSKEEREKDDTVMVGLRGHHIGRIVETVKMFLALHKAGLPIWINDPENVRNRILGLGLVGLIPESSSLHRGWQSFSSDLKIQDVMHFSDFGRNRRNALPFVAWETLPVLVPKKGFPFSPVCKDNRRY